MMKRWTSLLLALCLLLGLLPTMSFVTEAFTYSGSCGTNVSWSLNTDTGELRIYGSGAMADYSWYPEAPLYSYRSDIKTAVIETGVTSIGDYAFYYCDSLTSVTIGNSVTRIADYAFSNCDSLTSVTIPDSVTSIGDDAFGSCNSLMGIWASSANEYFSSDENGVLFNKDKTTLVQAPGAYSGAYTIPNSVTSIGDYAFYYCSKLTSVTIGNSVTSIGDWAFSSCDSLTSVTIPDSVTSISEGTFYSCENLTSVTIGNSVTSIGSHAFCGCESLTSVTIPDSVTSIGDWAFYSCDSLTSVTIGNSVTRIGDYAFGWCDSLTSVTIPDSVTSIGKGAFERCYSLTSITIPDSVTSIGEGAFERCYSLTSVTIPGSVTSIGGYAFSMCDSLTSVTIPDSVTSIASGAFYNCTRLTSVTIMNPNCSIFDDENTLGVSGTTVIYGHENSTAQTYAEKYGYSFVPLDRIKVSFDLNGGSGVAPANQFISRGGYVKKPSTPTREGYLFAGWYSNPKCTGNEWFNIYTNGKGNPVSQNITLYAKWENARTFTYGRDTFRFINSYGDFWGDVSNVGGHTISGDYYDILMQDLSLWEKLRVHLIRKSDWGGSCFGMSCVLSLVYADRLDVEFFQSGAECLHDLDYPRNNTNGETVFNLISYYHLMQLTNQVNEMRTVSDKNNKAVNNKRVVDAMQESSYPVVICFEFGAYGHAVVGYDLQETETEYLISIWDPNDKKANNILHISKDYGTSFFEKTYDSGNNTSRLVFALTVESEVYDFKNIQEELMGLGYTSGEVRNPVATKVSESEADYYTLYTNYDSFEISLPDGTSATVTKGAKTEGDLEISDGFYENEIGYSVRMSFSLPALAEGQSYAITPVTMIDTVSGEEISEYETTVVYSNDQNGFYSSVSAGGIGTVSVDSTGKTSTVFESDTAHTMTVTRNDMTTPWYSVSCSGTSKGMEMLPKSDAVEAYAAEEAQISVAVNDDYNSASFENVSLTPLGITVREDSENPGTAIIVNHEESVVAEDGMGCALIYYTMGGTIIETQTDIPAGTVAERPEDPARTGFVFGGWYTSPDCADGTEWSFDTPITADTRIYAKWDQDPNFFHTVTFRAEGFDDVVFIVFDGESLDETEIPNVPERVEYTGTWGEMDLTAITEDIVIEAIYTHNHTYSTTVTVPTCTEGGFTTYICTCGDSYTADEISATGHSYSTPADNGDGTHRATCERCGDAITEDHNFIDGFCVCGAVEVTEPVVDGNISIGETLSLESDLTMNFRIKTEQLAEYDLSTAYLVVERDVYNSDGTVEVETRTLTEYTVKDNRLVFAYTGISAAQMNDEIRAVLYIKDSSGKEYVSNEKVTSVAIYSDLMLGASAGNEKLITLIMDMLNYGTAAQIYFNRHADAPVNEAFESFKTYASYASSDLKSALEDMSGTISNGNSSATITQGLDLSTRVGITYKVKLPAGVDAANASLIIKDANGNELESFDLSSGSVDSKGRYCVTFFGSTSREMRRVVYATVMVDGEAISDTYTYTISSYAHTIANAAGMPEALVNLTRLMVIYGDSADAYFA